MYDVIDDVMHLATSKLQVQNLKYVCYIKIRNIARMAQQL